MENKRIYIPFFLIFFFGIMLILKSNAWNFGSYFSMNVAGVILCIFSGAAILIKLSKEQ